MTPTLVDLTARRALGEAAVARVASAPVRYVPAGFLAALLCVEVDDLTSAAPPRVLQLAR